MDFIFDGGIHAALAFAFFTEKNIMALSTKRLFNAAQVTNAKDLVLDT